MKTNNNIHSMDAVLDELYGKIGTPEREQFRKEAYAYYFGQMLHNARKSEKITQAELAAKSGIDKSYISRIEKGIIEPSVGTFSRIIEALGLKLDITKTIV